MQPELVIRLYDDCTAKTVLSDLYCHMMTLMYCRMTVPQGRLGRPGGVGVT